MLDRIRRGDQCEMSPSAALKAEMIPPDDKEKLYSPGSFRGNEEGERIIRKTEYFEDGAVLPVWLYTLKFAAQ